MAKHKTEKDGAGGGRNVTAERIATTTTDTPQPTTTTQLGEVSTRRGKVGAFTVDENRLLIKLNCSAISRILVGVNADQPHFDKAVSLTMMAYNNGEYLSVRCLDMNRPVLSPPEVVAGLEFGLGEDAFEIDDWPISPPD